MEILNPSAFEYGLARFILPGQDECGDDHVVRNSGRAILFAVVDGVGHGSEAAAAAKLAVSTLAKCPQESLDSLVYACHEQLRPTRGAALSLASIGFASGRMTWLGIGNVQGILLRAASTGRSHQQALLLRPGIVGVQLPALQRTVLPFAPGDMLVFATDGIRGSFAENLSALESPQKAADRILRQYCSGSDDALVFVARFSGNGL